MDLFFFICRKKHHSYLPKILNSLLLLLNDSSLQVQKKVIQTSTTLYKEVITWLAESNEDSNENALLEAWNTANSLKNSIINLVDNDHDGYGLERISFILLGMVIHMGNLILVFYLQFLGY